MTGRGACTDRVDRRAWIFLAPFAVGTALLVLLPAVLTFRWAFTDFTGLGQGAFTGLANLRRLHDDPFFDASVRASVWHVVIAVPLRLVLATALALLLSAPRRGGRWYRLAVYTPTVIPDIAIALVFLWVLNPIHGPLNQLLAIFGLPQPNWLAETAGARAGVIMMVLFPIGEAFLVALAARRGISPRLYEAAALEGARPWQRLRLITLPLMAPLLAILAVRDVTLALQSTFVPAYVLTDGGPLFATLYLPIYVFDQSFEFLGFGYGAMITLVVLAVTAVLVVLQLLLVRRWRAWRVLR